MARVCARYRNYRNEAVPSKASERVEIARRIEVALAGRVGNPQLRKHLGNSEKGESTDIAAKSVGWSGETYRKAKKVIDSEDEALSIKVLQYC
jgi:hypothetical protein